MSRQTRKLARKAAVQREVQQRENALAVPAEKCVYVFREHFSDEGGPRGICPKDFQNNPDTLNDLEWEKRLGMAPVGWEPVEIVAQEDPDFPTDQPIGDFSEFWELMIFSERSAEALEKLLQPCGLFLPLTSKIGNYVGFRLDAEVDALDVAKTSASWCPDKDATGSWRADKHAASSIYTSRGQE